MRLTRNWKVLLTIPVWILIYFAIPSITNGNEAPLIYKQSRASRLICQKRAKIAKEAFRHGWDAYMKYAFPNDDLKPLSQYYQSTRSKWGATIVDSLTTAIMMDMPDVANTMMNHIQSIEFDQTTQSISLFGSTIRYLGPLMSAYDLLTGPCSRLDPTGRRAPLLLSQAQKLAETLVFAFDTPTGIPQNNLVVKPKPRKKKTQLNDITAAGTLVLEWSHLSVLTKTSVGKPARKAFEHILSEMEKSQGPFPGMSGRFLSIAKGNFVDKEGGWYGGAGSFYEYLLKLYAYSPHEFGHCRDRWMSAADSTMKHLASHPSTRPDLTFLASYNDTNILYNTDHTAHFAAASFLLGGSVLGEQKYIDFGLQLVDSQIEMYNATATGIGPDTFAWLPESCGDNSNKNSSSSSESGQRQNTAAECQIPPAFSSQNDFYQEAGYYSTSPIYMLRPEVLESLYYAYRVTGDQRYQDASWELFQNILNHTMIDSGGFAELLDVNQIPDKEAAKSSNGKKGGMVDRQYSFMLAEVVKYAWLIQVNERNMPWHVRADGKNTWVFNTEAHPLRIRTQKE